MTHPSPTTLDRVVPLLGLFATVLVGHFIFSGFFPGPAGMGHDYAGGLPAMLAEYFWSRNEGVFAAPWFMPAFCGGIPWFADPGSMYYAFPSWFARLFDLDPLRATYLTFLLFIGIGFLGAYAFCRRALGLSIQASLMAGVLFGLNGFFTHRMLVGHIGFHGVMLVPWLALAVVSGPHSMPWRLPRAALSIAGGALVLAYWVHSGVQSLMVAFGLATAALIVLAWLRGGDISTSLLRSSLILPLGVSLAAAKLSASLAYMKQFPRSDYPLPGFGSITDTLSVAFVALFGDTSNIAQFSAERLENQRWILDRHEFEFGVSAVPLLLLLGGLIAWISRGPTSHAAWTKRRSALSGMLLVLLALPLLLNTYSPDWNAFLKSVPVVGSSSSLVRWFVMYVPIIIIAAAVAMDSITQDLKKRTLLAAISILPFIALTASADRGFYRLQNYDPAPIVKAFRAAADNPEFSPKIESVGAYLDKNGRVQLAGNRNDTMIYGVSQLACYVPIFGYGLENFPFKNLRLGPVLQNVEGSFNLKNPACFVFPEQNNCTPGDHFPIARKTDAERFAAYRSFAFEKSTSQKIAEWLSSGAWLLMLTLLAVSAWHALRQRG